MSTPVSSVTALPHDASPIHVQAKPPKENPQTTNNDTVEISSAAKSASPQKPESQTKSTNALSDHAQQARHLLSKQQAAAKAYKKQ